MQGLDLHLARLDAGACELFGRPLDLTAVRSWMAQGAAGGDVLLRVTVYRRALDRRRPGKRGRADVLVQGFPLPVLSAKPLRLGSVVHARHAPHLKHVGTFELWRHRQLAQAAGFDDALFTDTQGAISESTVWNIGFHDGERFVWPIAPALDGVGRHMLRRGLTRVGLRWTVRPVTLADLPRHRTAFLSNALDLVRPVASIDAQPFSWDDTVARQLRDALATEPWERL